MSYAPCLHGLTAPMSTMNECGVMDRKRPRGVVVASLGAAILLGIFILTSLVN
jgi:hypothetical protein